MLRWLKETVSSRSRRWRANLFRVCLAPEPTQSILDLGGGKGRHMARFYPEATNVHIADFNPEALRYAEETFGFTTHLVDGAERLPFHDKQFDIVFCSSVIEHVTGEKTGAIELFKRDGAGFKRQAFPLQARFAAEIGRIGRRYFVQTPARGFPIEMHSWLPLIGRFPTHWQWRLMRLVNRLPYPRKDNRPDWSLLSFEEFKSLFPDATIYRETMLGITKSFIAIGGDGTEPVKPTNACDKELIDA